MRRIAAPTTSSRLLAVLTALFAALALIAAPAAAQQPEVTPARADGENRYDTAAEIATLTYDDAHTAIIVTGEDFPDALAASFAAGTVAGPVLLVEHDEVPPETWAAIDELAVERVEIIGGLAAVSAEVSAAFNDAGLEVDRIAGEDRFETAADVAIHYGGAEVGELEGDRTALLASGEDRSFPDALSAGPLAARSHLPLLLTPADRIDPRVDATLEELQIDRVVIVGGTAAVSAAVATHYDDAGYTVERFGGDTRTDTARIVADNALARFGFSAEGVLLARGDAFPDALAASIHGAVIAGPILLTNSPTDLSVETEAWFEAACPAVDFIRALGGTAAVSTEVLDEAVAAAERCEGGDGQPHTEQSYIQAPQQAVTLEPGSEPFEVTVSGFENPESNPAPVNIALFPCEVADPTDPDDRTFRDANGDGFADGIGTTSTNSAVISSLHGTATDATHLDEVQPDANDMIRYTLESQAEDCAVNVVFHDANDNDRLDVDGEGRPLEHWNHGRVAWESGA